MPYLPYFLFSCVSAIHFLSFANERSPGPFMDDDPKFSAMLEQPFSSDESESENESSADSSTEDDEEEDDDVHKSLPPPRAPTLTPIELEHELSHLLKVHYRRLTIPRSAPCCSRCTLAHEDERERETDRETEREMLCGYICAAASVYIYIYIWDDLSCTPLVRFRPPLCQPALDDMTQRCMHRLQVSST